MIPPEVTGGRATVSNRPRPVPLVGGAPRRALAAGVVVPLPLLAGEWFAAAGAEAGPVFDGRLLGGRVVRVDEWAGFLADASERGCGDGGGLEVAACPGVAAVAVGAEHFGVGVEAVVGEVVAEPLDRDRAVFAVGLGGDVMSLVAALSVDPVELQALGRVVFVMGIKAGCASADAFGLGEVGEEAEAPGSDAFGVGSVAVRDAEGSLSVG